MGLRNEAPDVIDINHPIDGIDVPVELNPGTLAQRLQSVRKRAIDEVFRAIKEMYLSLSSSRSGQRLKACNKWRNTDSTSNPNLIFSGIAKVEASIRTFHCHRITDMNATGPRGARPPADAPRGR